MAEWVAEVNVSKSYDEFYTAPASAGSVGALILYDQKPSVTTITLTCDAAPDGAFTPPTTTNQTITVGGYTGLFVSSRKARIKGTALYQYQVTLRA